MIKASALTDIKGFLSEARPRKLRSMREFAESEIVLPSGPVAGSRFRVNRQPFTGLWFDQVDSGAFSRLVATGPTQSGKSLSCFVIPTLYHLFKHNETVVCGLPQMEMAGDKWREDLLPIIERTKYKEQLPLKGSGSRGGKITNIQFRNGATLKFMTGGGGDKSRAGFTTRVLVITEAARAVDEENADRERRQFVWCLPVIPTKWNEVNLDEHDITLRVTSTPRGTVPLGTRHLTAAIDLGKHLDHWVVVPGRKNRMRMLWTMDALKLPPMTWGWSQHQW